jgi:Arc/MetJ family transcription regulator
MRTTLDLDRNLLESAKKALGASSFTEAIEDALRQAVARAETRPAWESLIGSEMSWGSIDELLECRRRFGGRAL